MSAITSITAFLGVFCTFFLPPAYTLPFLGRMVLYLEIFFSLSQHYFTQNSTATTSEKQKSMWYSISHTPFVFLQDTAHNRSEYYHICIITKHINPPVKLSSSDSEVIPHGIRHRLPRLKLPNLRQREGPSSSLCHGQHTDMVFIWQALHFQKIEHPPATSPKQPNHKALPLNPINFPNTDYKALITYNGDKVREERNFDSSWQVPNHRSSSEIHNSHLTH